MNITARDRKIVMFLVPLMAILGFWFLVLAPKRSELAKLDTKVTESTDKRNAAKQQLDRLQQVKGDFATEYASVVRLGKAIPSTLDMPSLLVQLDSAARGTGIKFDRVAAGARNPAAAPAAAPTGSPAPAGGSGTPAASGSGGTSTTPAGGTQPPAAPGGSSSNPAAAGGTAAKSVPGRQAEKAGNAVNTQNSSSAASGQLDTGTSTSSRPGGGGLPIGGGASPQAGAPAGTDSGVQGLDSVSLDLDFSGRYFALADFLHRMKRFVRVNNEKIAVSGRLITIDGMELKIMGFGGRLTASMRATVYLVPKAQGVTAGATAAGPAAPASGQPAPSSPPPAATAAPTAAVTR